MKKRYKILLGILIFISIFLTGGYYWLINGWKKFISEDELLKYVSEIKQVPPLSKEFKELYYKLHPNQKEATLTGELTEGVLKTIMNKNNSGVKQNCSCDDIIHYDWKFSSRTRKNNSRYDLLKPIKLGFGLEKFLTNEECLNYSIRLQYNEIKDTRMGYSFAGKNFDDLNRDEIIDFFIAKKAPTYYSPNRYPDRYKNRKKVIEEQINKNGL